MNHKIKRIVAREGLIILGFVIFGLYIKPLLQNIPNLPGDTLTYKYEYEGKMYSFDAIDNGGPDFFSNEKISAEFNKRYGLHLTSEDIVHSKYWLPETSKFVPLNWLRYKFVTINVFFIYGLYWLIRFVIWAIRTLRANRLT